MKVILSRKGWDSGYGKRANPVFDDLCLQSLPIPDIPPSPTYGVILPDTLRVRGFGSMERFLQEYHPTFQSEGSAHLDPDLDRAIRSRQPGWRPCFGQDNSSNAARHLDKQGVEKGDLFLFYGWFDDVEKTDGTWRRKGHDRHVVWGWLQIGEILRPAEIARAPSWLRQHPHVLHSASYQENRIYVASPNLSIGGTRIKGFGGGGVFRQEALPRVLTKEIGRRGLYPTNLPDWLKPTRHRQEHVCDLGDSVPAMAWLRSIFV